MFTSNSAGCPAQLSAPLRATNALAFGASLLVACMFTPYAPSALADAPASPVFSSEVSPEQWPLGESPLQRDPAIERRIAKLLAEMSVEEKVGQLIQADIGSITPADIARYPLGSVLAGGNSAPGGKQYATAQEWLALADAYHQASKARGGVAIPLLFGVDAVHGHNNVIGATLFPHNIGLGAANDPDLVRRIARVTATELRVSGVEWTFAPTLTVPQDDRWGRSYEGYSEDPARVASYAAAVVEGLQGVPGSAEFLDEHHVLSSAKHFVGDGGTLNGRDQGDTRTSEAALRDIHAAGYPPAVAAGVQSVMASFSGWNGVKLHGHRGLLTDVLRGRMQFDGFVVGDWNGHGQVPGCSNDHCAASIEAGVDMFMAPDSWRGLFDNTLRDVRSKRLSQARLDEAVLRILRVKARLGLLDADRPSARALGGRFELIGHADHRAVAREAVRRSLVLLKNNGGLLPLDPKQRILIAGDGANDVAKQSGGWTLTWQGTGTQPSDFPNADSIWQGFRQQIEAAGGTAELAIDGRYSSRPDVAVVVFGEDPYAEFVGDIDTLAYRPEDPRDLQLLQRLRAEGIPVVAVFLSGRPLWVNREINAANAFVAAWLPGGEGGGIADVLLRDATGAVQHDFSGTLSFSWPRDATQFALNAGTEGYNPLFALGYGLSYATPAELAVLSEESGLTASSHRAGQWFARGSLSTGASLQLSDADGAREVAGNAPVSSPSSAVSARAIDHLAQEDARRFTWQGEGRVELNVAAPVDLERETNGDVLLVLSLRVDAAGAMAIGMRCGEDCLGSVDASDTLDDISIGSWTRLAIPLKCLRTAGADVTRISAPLVVDGGAGLGLSIARVELGTDAEHRIACGATSN